MSKRFVWPNSIRSSQSSEPSVWQSWLLSHASTGGG